MRLPNPQRVIIVPRQAAPEELQDDVAMPLPERMHMHDEEPGEDSSRFNGRQIQQQVAYQRMVELFGHFDQSAGPDGAHYMAANPFKKDGIACANCAFYEGPRGCEIVEGDIDPDAICKLWVIPADLMTEGKKPNEAKPSGGTVINYEDSKLAVKSARSEANMLPDRRSALRLARRLGCTGAHEIGNGQWAPCESPDALKAAIVKGNKPNKDGERERGIAGIATLPEGSLVSQKVHDMLHSIDGYEEVQLRRTFLDR